MGRRNGENNDRRTEQFRKLFIGGLTPQTDEIRLKKYYEQWGELVDFVVMKDNKTGRSRGFGFVTYRDPQMVDEAQNNRPHEIDGKIVEAKRAMPREDSATPESHMTVNKLFVGGLKKDVTKDQLLEYFSKFGTIIDCEIVTWKDTGESRGFGFVTFDDYDPVDKAILYKPHQVASSRVDVKKALSKDEMDEIKRKQTTEGLSADYYNKASVSGSSNNLSSSSSFATGNILATNPVGTTPTGHSASRNVAPCLSNLVFDANNPFPNAQSSYQYSTLAFWNQNQMLNNNLYYTRPLPDLNQCVNPSVINFGGYVTSPIYDPINNTMMDSVVKDDCDNLTRLQQFPTDNSQVSSNNIPIF